MSSNHTPGPWIPFQPRGDGSVPVRTDGLGLTICYVHDGAICDAIANARLIAAAPELLEALEELMIEVKDMTRRSGWFGCGARGKAISAIAKARGDMEYD